MALKNRCSEWLHKTSSLSDFFTRKMIALLSVLMVLVAHEQQQVLAQTSGSTITIEDYNPEDWYKRYPVYPPYCSIPSDLAKRQIPSLSDDIRPGSTRLLHTSVIIRHGARTPSDANMGCWEGYNEDPAFVWNCNLTTLLGTPSPHEIAVDESGEHDAISSTATSSLALFEKRYDALDDPANSISNVLNGTCQAGQLILRGYPQELTNGQILRKAYVYNSSNPFDFHDTRMQLIDVHDASSTSPIWDVSNMYHRVDDDHRTLMSGQILIRGLFGPEIAQYAGDQRQSPIMPVHVADKSRETMSPNHKMCPRLSEIKERLQESSTFQVYNESEEAKILLAFQQNVLKVNGMPHAISCLMTTICTDRPLPDAINDYRGEDAPPGDSISGELTAKMNSTDYGTNLFKRLFDLTVKMETLIYTENDSEYSKLSMGPLWAEILPNLQYAAGRISKNDICCPPRPPSKLAIFSGHDTTLMPLLASLGPRVFDGTWPPYASMIAIEMHQVNLDGTKDKQLYPTDYAFRLVYNGQVITSRMDGCHEDAELCDAEILFSQLESFATRARNCSRQDAIVEEYSGTVSQAESALFSTSNGVLAVVMLVLGIFAGSLVTYLVLASRIGGKGGIPRLGRRGLQRVSQDDEDFGDGDMEEITQNAMGQHSSRVEMI